MAKNYPAKRLRWPLAPAASGRATALPRGAQIAAWLAWLAANRRSMLSRALLLGAVALGTLLRLWALNRLGYNSDEAVYAGQGAAIAAAPIYKDIFPIFRAHPLLFQFVLAISFRFFGVSDLQGRLIAVLAGVATIYVIYQLGTLLYGRKVGLLAALLLAAMPYHVIVTRQVLLDGPMVLFATLTLYLLARFATTQHPAWLYAVGAGMGLTFLTKETGVVLLGAIYAFLSLSPAIRVRIRDLVGSMVCMVCIIAPHFIALSLVGRTKTAQQFVLWQLFRRPNHAADFYLTTVPPAIGPLVIVAALVGLWLLRRRRSWREPLLLAWVLVPTVFFQLWPVKGFQYLLPAAPALALLAARALLHQAPPAPGQPHRRQLTALPGRAGQVWRAAAGTAARVRDHHWLAALRRAWPLPGAWLRPLAIVLVFGSLLLASWGQINMVITDQFFAGTGGIPGGRAAGEWVRDNVPQGARLVAIGPSMANIIQFYGHRRTYGLSVSSNPLHRNPVYEAVLNPDRRIREGELQYFVYDVFSEARTQHFSDSLMRYVRRYHGRVVHTESVPVTGADGTIVLKPIIVIYEVRP
ncbi:MAG: glycosyltransferase family 39 protein [Kouleothrix sp.]|jgi:4-amino-4-deoxy-L-arabinose transferase-like glycosyltransferase|nr:glycosyltransferase family 39 protein [Kouleothrix sp.]